MRQKYLHIAILLFIPLIIILHFGQANYMHKHVKSNGEVFWHSHPYKIAANNSVPSSKHKHTSAQLLLLQFFAGSLCSDLNTLTSFTILLSLLFIFVEPIKILKYSLHSIETNYLRGPPTAV